MEKEERKNVFTTVIPQYKTEDISPENIELAKNFLSDKDGTDVTASFLTETLEELVKKLCDSRKKEAVTSEGTKFKSKNKIPRIVTLDEKKIFVFQGYHKS